MTLLDRYVSRHFLTTSTLLVIGLPLPFILANITDNIDTYLDRGLSVGAVALSYVYQLPLYVQYSFPIAALVGTVFTIGAMTTHVEITAAKSAGVSFYRIIAPIVVLAALLSLVAVVLGEIVPVTNRMRAELVGDAPRVTGGMRSDFVFQSERGPVLSVSRLNPAARTMTNVVLEEPEHDASAAIHGMADRAEWDPGQGWKLEQGYLRYLLGSGREETFGFATLRIPELRESPADLLAEPADAEEMGYREISGLIGVIERSGGDARPLRTERAQKISLPLAVLVIVIFGAPLATSTERGGAAYGVGISLVVTLVYLMLFKVAKAAGSSGWMDPIVAAWLPNALFLVAGGWLLARVRT
ncbi:LPS export ABC transporter permease LptG [soil metagenome]